MLIFAVIAVSAYSIFLAGVRELRSGYVTLPNRIVYLLSLYMLPFVIMNQIAIVLTLGFIILAWNILKIIAFTIILLASIYFLGVLLDIPYLFKEARIEAIFRRLL
jgi:hypothetical protein